MRPSLLPLVAAAILAVGCASGPATRSLSQPVPTDKGLVSGTGQDIRSFKGIPFAKAPTGDLRWRPPQPAAAWAGVRDGSRFGPDCMQPAEYPELRGDGMSEDCLHLNVWTPARTSAEKLPVLVWVHGGGFTYGSGSHPTYDGEALARRGVVVVTLNYRLGLFGFMAHPQLTAESPEHASGNYALMDQIAALQWVQRNAAAFGGDPQRVTVAAQSAGALAVSSLITSEKAKGLFHQAILQSVGVMRPMATLRQAEQFGLAAGPEIAQLRRAEPAAMVERLKAISPAVREMTSARELAVIVDGSVLKEDDRTAYGHGRYRSMPMIVGSNEDEGCGIARSLPVRTVADHRAYLRRNFPGAEEGAERAYGVSADASVLRALSDLASDTQFLFGTREMLDRVAPDQAKVYRYVFTQRRNGGASAPIHGAELQYPFGNLGALHRGRILPSNAADQRVADEMAGAWVRFVMTGNPNGGTLPDWPRYERGTQRYMAFGDETGAGAFSRQPRLDFIRDFYAAREAQP